MARVASCNDCGAKFKVPETTKAARAKCPKCGGVVAIPPAEGSTPPAPAAPKAPAPQAAKAAPRAPQPAAPKAPAPRAARAKTSPAKAPAAGAGRSKAGSGKAAAAKGKAAGGRPSRGGARRGKATKEKSSNNAGMIVGAVVLLAIAGGAAWWFGFRDDGSTTATDTTAMSGESSAVAPDSSGADDMTDAVVPPSAAKAEADEAVASNSAPAESTDDSAGSDDGGTGALDALTALTNPTAQAPEAAAPVDQAPAAVTEGKVDPDEPLDTLIMFEPFGPIEGASQQDLEDWTVMLKELYIEDGGATGRTRKRLRAQAAEVDIIQLTPAFLNAIIGVDLKETESILGVFTMVKDWQERVGYVPTFFFDGDVNATEVIDQNKRVKVVELWHGWWLGYASGKGDLVAYREKMEKSVKDKAR